MLLMNSFSIKILFIICVVLGVISGLLSLFIRIQFQTVKAKMIQYIKRFDFEPLYCERSNTCCNRYDAHWCDLCSNFNLFTSICRRKKLSHSGKLLLYLYAVASLFTRPIAGRLMDDKNENVVVYPAFIFLVISFAMLMFSFNGWMLLIAGIALGIGYGNLSSSMQAIAIKVSPSTKYGLATSTYFIGLDIGIGFGPSFLGLFTHMITYSQLFGIMGILGVVTLIIYLLVHGRKVKHQSI